MQPIVYRGLAGWVTGWAEDGEGGTVYVSLIGRKTALEAIWAAFHSYELVAGEAAGLRKRREPEAATYHSLRAHLPQSGWQHLVLVYSQATVNNVHDEDFFVIGEAAEPPLERFWQQWNNALPLPARPEWVAKLWQEGQRAGLIRPCRAAEVNCWQVSAEVGGWQAVIEAMAHPEAL